MEIISNVALISINATLVVQLLSFLIFLFIINRIMLQPLHGIIKQRDDYINRMKDEITAARQRLKDLAVDLEKQKQAIKSEAFKVNEEKEKMASNEATLIYSQARKQVVELRKAAEKDVAKQLTEAQKYFEDETRTISAIMMEHILGRRIN